MTVFVEFICEKCGVLAEEQLDDDYTDEELERSRTCISCIDPLADIAIECAQ